MSTNSPAIYLFLYVKDFAASHRFYKDTLGLKILELEERAVKYDTGEIILALNVASDFGVELSGEEDRSQLIVFHVDDLHATRKALEDRGVTFTGPTERYEIGATATFYDPDGHSLMIYEPSEESLTWPSGDKVREILAEDSRSHTILRVLDQHRSQSDKEYPPSILGDRKILYIFNFITDGEASRKFYTDQLGLGVLEEDPDVGVVKYDAGGVLLATHLVDTQDNAPRSEHMGLPRSTALVFHTRSFEVTHERLVQAGVPFDTEPATLVIGEIARFHDPDGHNFYLYEPSSEALSWPSGAKILYLAGTPAPVAIAATS